MQCVSMRRYDRPELAPAWHSSPTSLSGCSYNKFTTQEEAIKAQWSAGAEPAAAAERPDSEPRRDRQGLRGARRERLQGHRRLAQRSCSRPKRPKRRLQAANQQSSALGRLLAVVENYPNLKANEQFNRLMDELSGTREPHRAARMRYNEAHAGIQHVSGGSSPATSPPRCSASRNTPTSRRRRRRRDRPRSISGRSNCRSGGSGRQFDGSLIEGDEREEHR